MQQLVLHRFPANVVKYRFKCRTKNLNLIPYINRISEEIDHLCTLRFTEEELVYLNTFDFFKKDYIDFLRMFQLNRKHIKIGIKNRKLDIVIEGPWWETILFEVPILSIVNEVYYNENDLCNESEFKNGEFKLKKKIKFVKKLPDSLKFTFADFGTRRRRSKNWHEYVVKTLAEELPGKFVGTSNVWLAMKHNVKPIGTMAHEFLQGMQAMVRLSDSQKYAFENWVQEYRGDLGIALTDVVGMDAFLRDFDKYFCKLFDGCRHDSGDPYKWCEKLIVHYKNMGIDPMTKTAVFSDGLTIPKAINLVQKFHNRIKMSFGIGTNLTNDCETDAISIVIKMIKCNGMDVAKVSDSSGKTMCENEEFLTYLKQVFQIEG